MSLIGKKIKVRLVYLHSECYEIVEKDHEQSN